MTTEQIRRIAEDLTKKLASEGRLIEGGWNAFELVCIHPDASEAQRECMRLAYYAGCQHLFASITTMLDPGEEETAADMNKMQMIQDEVNAFRRGLEGK
jgi:hypothetical protein